MSKNEGISLFTHTVVLDSVIMYLQKLGGGPGMNARRRGLCTHHPTEKQDPNLPYAQLLPHSASGLFRNKQIQPPKL